MTPLVGSIEKTNDMNQIRRNRGSRIPKFMIGFSSKKATDRPKRGELECSNTMEEEEEKGDRRPHRRRIGEIMIRNGQRKRHRESRRVWARKGKARMRSGDCRLHSAPDILFLNHGRSISRQSSTPAGGFSTMEQVKLCASMIHIQGSTTVR